MPNKRKLRSDEVPYGAIRVHGNYVGPGWSGGKYQKSVESDVPAIDEFDQTAKEHDEAYALGQNLKEADYKFAKANIGKGIKRSMAGISVGIQGMLRRDFVTPEKQKSLSNLRGSKQMKRSLDYEEDMDVEDAQPPGQPLMAARSFGTAADNMGKETQVTVAPTITYGIQDTHTTILPYTFYVGSGFIGSTGLSFEYQLNSLYNPIISTISTTIPSTPGNNTWYSARYRTQISGGATTYGITFFPENVQNSKPAWRAHWDAYYNYYTVLGVEYNINMYNVSPDYSTAIDATQYDGGYSDLIVFKTLSGNTTVPANATQYQMNYWKNVQKMKNYSQSRQRKKSSVLNMSGVWKPGDYKREVRDDTEAKVWTQVSASPTLKEVLHLKIFPESVNDQSNSSPICTMECTFKYIVQFKDQKSDFKYPQSALWS